MAEYAWTVTARYPHWCDDTRGSHGPHRIPTGAPYVRCVAFPDGDLNQDTRPWVVRLCSDCYCQFGAQMPDRRTSCPTPSTATDTD